MTEAIQIPIFPLKFNWRENRSADRASSYRQYDSQVGRFISRDPLLFRGGQVNLFAYSLNDPVNYVDQSGKNPLLIIGGFGLAGAIGNVIGTIINGNVTFSGLADAAAVGFVSGAIAGVTVVGSVITGTAALGTTLIAGGIDILRTLALAPSNLPSGSLQNLPSGINVITNPQTPQQTNPACGQ